MYLFTKLFTILISFAVLNTIIVMSMENITNCLRKTSGEREDVTSGHRLGDQSCLSGRDAMLSALKLTRFQL